MELNRPSNADLPLQAPASSQCCHSKVPVLLGCLLLASIALLTGAARPSEQAPAVVAAGSSPQANNLVALGAAATSDPLADEHRQEISEDSAKLLALAQALKTEVDKTNKDMLSLVVIRKADEIEKLAHSVRGQHN